MLLGIMIKLLSVGFLGLSHIILGKIRNAVYRLEISALVFEIFKFEKRLKYANVRTDDVIHSTQYNSNLQHSLGVAVPSPRRIVNGRMEKHGKEAGS